MGYRWNLRKLMATRDMYATTDLVPLLAERGIHLSREQVFRLVTTTPQRLSLDTLAALCDILRRRRGGPHRDHRDQHPGREENGRSHAPAGAEVGAAKVAEAMETTVSKLTRNV